MLRTNLWAAIALFLSAFLFSSQSQAIQLNDGSTVKQALESSSLIEQVDLRGRCWKRHRRCTRRYGRGRDYRRCMARRGCHKIYRRCLTVRRLCRIKRGGGRDYRRCVRRKGCRAYY